MKSEFIVIGGGAAGMLAAYCAAQKGVPTTLIDKNKSLGRKLRITGGGRCNLTNMCDVNELVAHIPENGRFLYSAFRQFDAQRLVEFCRQELQIAVKVERGRRVFPVSEQAKEVVEAFAKALRQVGVKILTEKKVTKLSFDPEEQAFEVVLDSKTKLSAANILLATGGASYPGTGSTGDGYPLAAALGHQITPLFPALVPLEVKEAWAQSLEGLSLVNVSVSSYDQEKKLETEFGELVFTSFGLSGPVILSLSRKIAKYLTEKPQKELTIKIDLKPALSCEELDRRIQRDFQLFSRKIFKNSLDELLPNKLIPVIIELSLIDPHKKVNQISQKERQRLVHLLKNFSLTITKTRSLAEAIVTAGGVSIKEINPKTMKSKLIPGLYFAGEVIDVDAYTGGYNLQIAFATGYAAAKAVINKQLKGD